MVREMNPQPPIIIDEICDVNIFENREKFERLKKYHGENKNKFEILQTNLRGKKDDFYANYYTTLPNE
jgi:hypothetical protein